MKLERLLAERYASWFETSRILETASIERVTVPTETVPLTRWNYIIGRLESSLPGLRRLLHAVQGDYPDDAIVQLALTAIETALDPGRRAAFESLESGAGSRANILGWLQSDWRKMGPCVCCIQGFSGVGKSYTADILIRSGSFQNSSLVEIPNGRTSFEDALLLINESLDRDLDTRLVMGKGLALELEKVLTSPLLLVIDDFQNCLEPNGSPLPGFEEFFGKLRIGRHHGRILLLSSQAVDEESFERVSVRTMGGLRDAEGAQVLKGMLTEATRESEVPDDLVDDVVSWLGGNPRALKTLVAALGHFPLEELIELDPEILDLQSGRMSAEMSSRLEKRLVRKTYAVVSAESQRSVKRLSVHRRSFKYEVIESAIGSGLASNITKELKDNFLLDRSRKWYSLNPIVREVALTVLAEDQAGHTSAHRAAASYYARPFMSRNVTVSKNAANFIEVRYHLMAIGDLNRFASIARLYALYLEKVFDRKTKVPSNQDEISQQIATLDGALAGGSPSADLHYYLAKLFIARDGKGDKERAAEELKEAIILQRCPADAWFLLIDLGELETVYSVLTTTPIEVGSNVYLRLAKALREASRDNQALDLLRAGITRVSPEHGVSRLYQPAAGILEAAGRRDEAIELLRAGITGVGPEHGVAYLFQPAARMLEAAGRRDEAIELLRAGITRLGPEHGLSYLYHAAAGMLEAAGRRDEAIELLRAGIARVGPEHDVAYLFQPAAGMLEAVGRRDEAIELLRAGIARLGPEHGVAYLYHRAAGVLEAAGRRDEAIELLRAGMARLGPEHGVGQLYQAAANALEAGGRRDEGLELLRAGIARVGPEHGLSHLYHAAAGMLEAAGPRDEAIELLRAGIARLAPEHGASHLYQAAARMLEAAGRRDEAIELLRAGIARLGPEHDVVPLYQAAIGTLAAVGRHQEAIDVLDAGRQRGLVLREPSTAPTPN